MSSKPAKPAKDQKANAANADTNTESVPVDTTISDEPNTEAVPVGKSSESDATFELSPTEDITTLPASDEPALPTVETPELHAAPVVKAKKKPVVKTVHLVKQDSKGKVIDELILTEAAWGNLPGNSKRQWKVKPPDELNSL